jgi:hypothetical protein
MSSQDKALECSDCGITFTFSAEDQEFYQSKGNTHRPVHSQDTLDSLERSHP